MNRQTLIHQLTTLLGPQSLAASNTLAGLLLVLFAVAGCTGSFASKPKPMPNIPIYPGAQGVQVEEVPRSKSKIGVATRITSFTTSDPANKVLSYYKDLLSKVGWRFNTSLTPEPNTLYAGLTPGVGSKDPVYGLRIDVKVGSDGVTVVEVNLGEYLYH